MVLSNVIIHVPNGQGKWLVLPVASDTAQAILGYHDMGDPGYGRPGLNSLFLLVEYKPNSSSLEGMLNPPDLKGSLDWTVLFLTLVAGCGSL